MNYEEKDSEQSCTSSEPFYVATQELAQRFDIDSRRDISRAITGEELLNRLLPRIEVLFQ